MRLLRPDFFIRRGRGDAFNVLIRAVNNGGIVEEPVMLKSPLRSTSYHRGIMKHPSARITSYSPSNSCQSPALSRLSRCSLSFRYRDLWPGSSSSHPITGSKLNYLYFVCLLHLKADAVFARGWVLRAAEIKLSNQVNFSRVINCVKKCSNFSLDRVLCCFLPIPSLCGVFRCIYLKVSTTVKYWISGVIKV